MDGNTLYACAASMLEVFIAIVILGILTAVFLKSILVAAMLCGVVTILTVVARALYFRYEAFRDYLNSSD